GFALVASYPELKNTPIVIGESDPEGCAACQGPQLAYRNGTMYPTYTALALATIFKLADKHGANIEGMQSWSFEFEDQPWFDGFRSLATNGVAKPVLNLFRMAGQMSGDRVKVESNGAIDLDAMLKDGVRNQPSVDALASRGNHEIAALVWNYHDDIIAAPDAPVRLTVSGVPHGRVLVRHYRIDQQHSNAYTLWQKMGSPQQPTPEQYAELEAAGQLQLLNSPEYVNAKNGQVELKFALPRLAVSLVQVSW
ncbi:MAG: beta-xylosidase, partial [Acidobacteria bacterium]|nr:beta-xylosidase [Acidobacteriota bacterium]